mgnify:CR=1 FL=1
MKTIYFIGLGLNSSMVVNIENEQNMINALLATGHVITKIVENN